MDYVDITDESIPLGKRKQAFVKWLMHKGRSLDDSKLICYKKFYHEIKAEEEMNREEMQRIDNNNRIKY